MQQSLFSTPLLPSLDLQEDVSEGYSRRTTLNAKSSDITLAFAVDFESAGERLTKKVAMPDYVPINFGEKDLSKVFNCFLAISQQSNKTDGLVINIAGNGQYRFIKQGISQDQVNLFVYKVLLYLISNKIPIKQIRTGGQTGADWAGLVAAVALEVPALGYFPKGFKQKNQEGVTLENQHKDSLISSILKQAQDLKNGANS